VLKDLASVLPDEYIHLGGDEANTACWEQSKAITDWIAKEGLGGVAQALRGGRGVILHCHCLFL
jgi:N-acetyl-beta-hexosaminidase